MIDGIANFTLAHSDGLLAFAAVVSAAYFAWRHKPLRLAASLAAIFIAYVLLEVYP